MPAPEPTWAQKAQRCEAALGGCNDQLGRFEGIERELEQAQQELTRMVNSAPDVAGLSRQIEFWKREAQTAQQREATLQGRVQQLDKALREAPTKELVNTVSVELELTQERYRQAAQQAAECRTRAAGMVQRLQQFKALSESLGRMEQAADQWQRRASQYARENSELRQEVSALPELREELAHVTDKLGRAGEHIQRVEARLVEAMPAARALPTVRADLIQANEELDKLRRELREVARQRDLAKLDAAEQREKLEQLRRQFG